MEVEEKKYTILQNIRFLIRESMELDKRILIFTFIAIVTGIVTPVFGIYLPKAAVDLLVKKAGAREIALVMGGIAGGMLILYGLREYFERSRYFFWNNYRKVCMRKIYFHSIDMPYSCAEDAGYCQMYDKAVTAVAYGDNSGPSRFFRCVPELLIHLFCFVIYSGIISTLHIGVVFLLLLSTLVIWMFERKESACYEETMAEYAGLGRQYRYTVNSCQNVRMGKDIRVYRMSGWLAGLIRLLQKGKDGCVRKRKRQELITQIAGCVLNLLRDGIAYTYLVYLTVQGEIGMGDFMLYFGAITSFSEWMIQIIWGIGNLKTGNNQLNYIRTFLDIPVEDEEEGECDLPDLSDGVEIDFDHVSFRYPNSERDVVHDITFTIHKGERVAIVGLNGAGKTTLVKLMTGFYEPTGGTIRVNGVELSRLSKQNIYSLYSAVFQEALIFPFMVDENIALKRKEEIDEERIEDVLEQSGLAEEMRRRGIHKDSYMTQKLVKEGINFSGGQQQKFLLARALYKDSPVLVLDEPTAALDPLAEKEMYEQYESLCEGKTALFISHRLASTQFSDRILFLKDGRVEESGSHEELLMAKGEYAHLFEVQSYYYNLSEEQREEVPAWM